MAITVTALSSTPIKGTRIREVDSIELGPEGAHGDRAFYVVNADGTMVNGKRLASLQTVIADYRTLDQRLCLRFPDGTEVADSVRLGAPAATTFFGVERPARELDGPFSAALSELAGEPLRLVEAGSAVDRGAAGAVSLVSRGSLERLAAADHDEPVDARRFRMLIEIDGVGAHEEDRWIDRDLEVGPARLRMHGHVGRCVTTTRSPDTGEVDYPTLKLLATYRLDEATTEPLAFGVHGEVVSGGVVRVGDPVEVAVSAGATTERVAVAIADHVATVTLSRPEKHNALDVAMFDGILGAAERVAAEPGVRAVVLHGAGPSFCSGLDVASLMSGDSDPGRPTGVTDRVRGAVPNWFQRATHAWIELPVPVIAALHGNVFGGGLQIALGADLRIAAPDARLSVMEVKWGLIPDMAITRTLPRLVAIDVAKELTFTGRVLSGDEAAALGLVTRLAEDPLAAARALAAEIATRSPDAVRRAKRLFDESWTGTAERTLALEATLQLEVLGSRNQLAAVAAGFSGRPGEFVDP